MDIILYTVNEVSDFLKICNAFTYRLIAQGEIAAVRLGRTLRVRQEDLLSFIQNNMTIPMMQPGRKNEANNKSLERDKL